MANSNNFKRQAENEKKIPLTILKELTASYSNVVNMTASKDEIFFDFITVSPNDAKIVSRVVMSIKHTKKFAKVLNNFVKKIK